MYRYAFLFTFLAGILSSCTEHQVEPNIELTGDVPEYAGRTIYFEELEPLGTVLLDSMKIDGEGAFSFETAIGEAGFYLLKTSPEDQVLLQLDPGEHIFLHSSGPVLNDDLLIRGSPGSIQIRDFEKFMALQRKRVDSLGSIYNEARGRDDFLRVKRELDSLYLVYVEDQRNYIFRFYTDHPGSMVNLILINRRLGKTVVIDEKDDFLHLYRIDSMLQLRYPGNKHTVDHHERVKALRGELFDSYVMEEKLSPGKKAPDVVMNDTSNRPVSLKSYAGKQVILQFWAGWDARSREDNRELIRIYPELQKKNIEILGISLDEHEGVWKGAIRLDRPTWPQVSELKGMYSKIVQDYHLPVVLPYYYLIDEDQRIKYKDARLDSLLVRLN